MNPELQRLYWTNFKAGNLIFNVFLILLFSLMATSHHIMLMLYLGITFLMSLRATSRTIFTDQKNEVWEQQRLSVVGAGALMFGKVIGYLWLWTLYFGLAMIMLTILAPKVATNQFLIGALIAYLASVLLHLYVIYNALRQQQFSTLFVIIGAICLFFAVMPEIDNHTFYYKWYRFSLSISIIYLMILAVGIALMLLSLWSLIRQELMILTPPWVTLFNMIVLIIFGLGFVNESSRIASVPAVIVVTVIMLYMRITTEKFSLPVWNRMLLFYQQSRFYLFFCSLPSWSMFFIIVLFLTLIYMVQSPMIALTFFLTILRDIAIALMIWMGIKDQRMARNTVAIYWFFLFIIVPFLSMKGMLLEFFIHLSPHLIYIAIFFQETLTLDNFSHSITSNQWQLLVSMSIQSGLAVMSAFSIWNRRNREVEQILEEVKYS